MAEKRVFDEITRRRVGGLLPFLPNSSAMWTPPELEFLPIEQRPVFDLKPYTKVTLALRRTKQDNFDATIENMKACLKQGVAGWSNLLDYTGEILIEFSPESIAAFPEALIIRLDARILEMTVGLNQEEREGLGSSPPPAPVTSSKVADAADVAQA